MESGDDDDHRHDPDGARASSLRHASQVLLGLIAQFTIMPVLGWGLSRLLALEPAFAVGLILVAPSRVLRGATASTASRDRCSPECFHWGASSRKMPRSSRSCRRRRTCGRLRR